MSGLGRFLNRLLGNKKGTSLSPQQPSHEDMQRARTLEPAGVATIHLPSSFKLQHQEANKWPDGFWDHFNTGVSHYRKGHYCKAKTAYLSARSLLTGYAALETALLRTYRKLYKGAIDKELWDEAYGELCELIEALPAGVTDTDRRQFNKVVKVLKESDPSFQGQPLPLQKRRETRGKKPAAEVDSASGIGIEVQRDDTWERPKGERPLRWQERQLTTKGFVAVHRAYDEQAGGYTSCRIMEYSPEGEMVSERDWEQSFYRLKVSQNGEHLIGYSDDLKMSLWTFGIDRLAERSIAREADNNKYHVRCVDLSEDTTRFLFTSSTRAYLVDQLLRTLRVWIMPPPAGYEVEHESQDDTANEQIERALATLELTGHPTQEAIKAQFRRIVFRYHPDRNPGNVAAQERTKEIILAYKRVSEEDVVTALEGLGGKESYYQVLHEADVEVGSAGLSMKFTISMIGPGDWIYASHMISSAERIYLGCYSGVIYSVDVNGNVLKVYHTDAPIDGILERGSYLYIWTSTSLYVLQGDKVTNHIDLREGGLECFAEWGLIVKEGRSLVLFAEDGSWIGTVRFSKEPREVIPAVTGLVAYSAKERFLILFSDPPAAASVRS